MNEKLTTPIAIMTSASENAEVRAFRARACLQNQDNATRLLTGEGLNTAGGFWEETNLLMELRIVELIVIAIMEQES